MIKFDICIIPNRLEFELKTNGKWYACNKNKNIQLEIKDTDIKAALSDILISKADKDDILELIIVTAITKLESYKKGC